MCGGIKYLKVGTRGALTVCTIMFVGGMRKGSETFLRIPVVVEERGSDRLGWLALSGVALWVPHGDVVNA